VQPEVREVSRVSGRVEGKQAIGAEVGMGANQKVDQQPFGVDSFEEWRRRWTWAANARPASRQTDSPRSKSTLMEVAARNWSTKAGAAFG